MASKTLVLSIALNGYQLMYQSEIRSHMRYAKKFGYVYQVITRPFVSALGVECCWLKLTLIRAALLSGYKNVLFLDADTLVNSNCPSLNSIYQTGKFIYMAKGYSQRFNSGVMLARNNECTIQWLTQVINARTNQVEKENDVGWGENGHVIELSKGVEFIAELSKKWNNTADYQLNDYIRHRNCGPLRTNIFRNFVHKVIFYLSAKLTNLPDNHRVTSRQQSGESLLSLETIRIISIYPKLACS